MNLWERIEGKISFHAVYCESILAALEFATENNFSGIQIAVELPHLSFEMLTDSEVDHIQSFCKKYNKYITLHAPDDVTSLYSTNSSIQESIFQYYSNLFDFAERIRSPLVTIHLGSMTTFPTVEIPEKLYPEQSKQLYLNALKNNLEGIISLVKNRFFLCVENYKLNPEVLSVLELYLDKKRLYLCWDLAKSYLGSGEKDLNLINFFLSHNQSIKQLHLHDIKNGRQHREIGSGVMDYRYFLSQLELNEIIDLCIEVRPEKYALSSKEKLKKILLH